MTRVLFLVLILLTPSLSEAVTSILGGSVQDPPTSIELLCTGSAINQNCPQFMHPYWPDPRHERFYGITNRVNPGLCVQSFDGARTFSLCPAHPFVGATSSLGIKFAVASDGSLLAAAGQGANTCDIRRSTDQGNSWISVFTSTTRSCGLLFASPTTPEFYCAETGGYCALADTSSPSQIIFLYSSDNGASWTVDVTLTWNSADSRLWGPILSADGGVGVAARGVNALTGQPFGNKLGGGGWVVTANYTPSVPTVNMNCRPYLSGVVLSALCTPNAGGTTMRRLTVDTVPIEIGNVELPVQLTASGLLPMNYDEQDGAIVALDNVFANILRTFATSTNWNDVVQIGGVPFINTAFGCCLGNQLLWNGTIYFTTGYSGSTAVVMKGAP